MDDKKKKKDLYDNKYKKENYDRITMMSPKGTKEKLHDYAERAEMSASMFLNVAMQEKMDRMDAEDKTK